MIKNYFKTAWRNLSRNKISSFINIGGLAIGMAVALLIGLWIYDELSFNSYHKNHSRIGRILIKGNDAEEGPFVSTSLPYPLATELRENYKGNFKHIVRASWEQEYILSAGDKKLSGAGQFMDPDAPEMFTLKMVKGSWSGLKDMHSIILSSSIAKAFFGNTDPVNQVVMINNKTNVKVTGVYEDLPLNSAFNQIKFLSTWDLWVAENDWILKRAANDWMNHFLRIYAEIPSNSSFESVNKNIAAAEMQKN